MADDDFAKVLSDVKDQAAQQPAQPTPVAQPPIAPTQPAPTSAQEDRFKSVLQDVKTSAADPLKETVDFYHEQVTNKRLAAMGMNEPGEINPDEPGAKNLAQWKGSMGDYVMKQAVADGQTVTSSMTNFLHSMAQSGLAGVGEGYEGGQIIPHDYSEDLKGGVSSAILGTAKSIINAPAQSFASITGAVSNMAIEFGRQIGHPAVGRDIALAMQAAYPEAPHLPEAVATVSLAASGVDHNAFINPPLPLEDARAVTNGIYKNPSDMAQSEALQISTAASKYNNTARLLEDNQIADLKNKITENPQKAGVYQTQIDRLLEARKPTEAPVQDIHTIARQIAPDVLAERDALDKRTSDARAIIGDSGARRAEIEKTAPHVEEISNLQEQLDNEKNKTEQRRIRTQIRDLEAKNDEYVDSQMKDTPEIAAAREELGKVRDQQSELGPKIQAAYQEAQKQMPDTASVSTDAVPFSTDEKPTAGATFDIASDAKKRLLTAGRTEEQATAESKLIQARYETAATNGWTKGNAGEIYQRHMVEIKATKGALAKTKELAQEKVMGTNSPSFKKWFGESKVVDEKGEPLVVYHATTRDFSQFDRSKKSELFNYGDKDSGGHFFSTENQSIDYYTSKSNGKPEEGANVIPVYLNIKNPVEISTTGSLESQAKLLHDAEAAGHDGALLNGNEWVAFKPEQIKSVHNEGTFDKNNPDILKQSQRGSILLASKNGGQAIIKLFKQNDASTLMHELSHHWLDEMASWEKADDAPKDLKTHMDAIRKWLGSDTGEFSGFTAAQHEKWARGFESYLRDGVAPSAELANAFAHFKQWLSKIYQTVAKLKVDVSPEVRNVFDHMLAVNPERQNTVIAAEHEPGKAAADIHEADVKTTPPEHADVTGDIAAKEIDKTANLHNPEIADVIKNAEKVTNIPEQATGGATDVTAAEPGAAGRGAVEEPGQITTGGSGSEGEGAATRAEPTAERGRATGDEKPIRSKPVEKLFDKAGNIILDNLTNDDEIRSGLRAMAAKTNVLDHEVVSDVAVAQMAQELGTKNPDKAMAKLQAMAAEDGVPLAAYVRASREMLANASKEVRELADKVQGGTEADFQNALEAKDRFMMIASTVSETANELGRALRAFQDISGAKKSAEQLEELFQQQGTSRDSMKSLFQLIASKNTGDLALQVPKLIQDAAKPGFWDHFAEYRRCSILSGFVTHALWLTGTGINLLYKPIVLDTLGGIRNEIGMVLGKEDTGSTITGGVQGLSRAIMKSLPNILSATGTAIRTGKTVLRPFEGQLDTYLATGGIRKVLNVNLDELKKATDSAFKVSDYPELKNLQDKIDEANAAGKPDRASAAQSLLDEKSTAKKAEVAQKIAAQMQSRLKTWGELAGEIHDFGSSAMAGALAVGKNILSPGEFIKGKPALEARRGAEGVLPDIYAKGVPILPIGTVMRGMSSRIYSSMHTFARETTANIETLQEARRMAVSEGLEGEALQTRISDLLSAPTKELMQKVNQISNKQTLMSNESEWAKAATRMRNAIDQHTGTKIGSVLMPVVGVPAEAVRQTVAESSPIGFLDRRERDALSGKMGPVEQERAQVKMFAGTALIGLGIYMGQKGLSTPSPSVNYNEEQERRDAGQQSGSIRTGDTMVSLQHVPVTGTLITLGSDLAHILNVYKGDDISDKIRPAVASAIDNFLLHENALVELSDAVNAIRGASDPSTYLKNQAVSTVVPAFVKQTNDLLDPNLRESKSFISSLVSRIPGQSESLAPRIDALTGEPLPREPLHTHTANPDPIAQQLMAMHIYPTTPHPVINDVNLTPHQGAEYASIKGHILHNGLQMLMQESGKEDFDQADVTEKRKMVQKIETHASECAKSYMFSRYPEILKDANDKYEASCAAEIQ